MTDKKTPQGAKSRPISPKNTHFPASTFKWRDRGGNFLAPSQMVTRHVFYTLRMIWNHRMPVEARLEPYREYDFGSFYTDAYLASAIRALGQELGTRDDLLPSWESDLRRMIEWLSTHQLEADEPGHGQPRRIRHDQGFYR